MKAGGCRFGKKFCHFPNDRYADITLKTTVPIQKKLERFYFNIEWGRSYINAPSTVRNDVICTYCAEMLWEHARLLVEESHAIDRYYERSDREHSQRSRHA